MSDQPARDLLPIFLNVRNVPVLIVGGGAVGCRRAKSLIDAGAADVTIVAPQIGDDAPPAARQLLERFRAGHLRNRRLVFAATDSPAVNQAVAEAAARRGILCCRADDAAAGDFVTPLAISAGPVTAAISAGSPSLTRRVGAEVSAVLGRWSDLAAATATLRPALLAGGDPAAARAALTDLATDAARDLLAHDGRAALLGWLAGRHPTLRHALPE